MKSYSLLKSLTLTMIVLLLCLNTNYASKTWLNTQNDVCHNGMGFNGFCVSSKSKNNFKGFPSFVASAWKVAQAVIEKTPWNPSICVGDFSTTQLQSSSTHPDLQRSNCNGIPLTEDSQYGVLAAAINKVPCGKPVNVNMCLMFDKCGTVAWSMNGGTIACMAATTGIGASLSAVAETLEFAQFGYSYHKKFKMSVKVTLPINGKVVEQEVWPRGHFYFGVKMPITIDYPIGKFNLKDYISLTGTAKYLVNFGKVASTVTRLVNICRNFEHGARNAAKGVIHTLLKSGAELAISLHGDVTIQIGKMSHGFLKDLNFSIDASAIISLGQSDTGLPMGFYVDFRTNFNSSVLSYIKAIYDHFFDVLKMCHIPKPKFPSVPRIDMHFGLFIQTQRLGIIFEIFGQNVTCSFHYKSKNASCNFGGLIFKAIAAAAKWLIKKGKEVVMKVAKGVGKFAVSAAKFVKNKVKKLYKKAKKVLKAVKKKVKKVLKSIKKKAKKAMSKVKNFFKGLGRKRSSRRSSRRAPSRRAPSRRNNSRRSTPRRNNSRRAPSRRNNNYNRRSQPPRRRSAPPRRRSTPPRRRNPPPKRVIQKKVKHVANHYKKVLHHAKIIARKTVQRAVHKVHVYRAAIVFQARRLRRLIRVAAVARRSNPPRSRAVSHNRWHRRS